MIQGIERSWQLQNGRLQPCGLGESSGSLNMCERVFSLCTYILVVVIERWLAVAVGGGSDVLSSYKTRHRGELLC